MYLPSAVVFVSTQLSEVGGKIFGAADDDKLAKLMEVTCSFPPPPRRLKYLAFTP
jgi:hypothetical protein